MSKLRTPKPTTLDALLQQLAITNKPTYFVIGCASGKAEVLVTMAVQGEQIQNWEELAHRRREQASSCFPKYDQVHLYLRLPNGRICDITNE
ncbi:hypothetical protein FAES_4043 [Fibrella aestuarina BUZ 2]|uniref:Uncharacterized protein n=1 Tax=Fibrella aestuarina BUZ 2 TaxID=1166018 RepID=I0KD40_9BACT|nr:hypothetical protein [Fibrella aestuarina]CCH02043.1 hypothetical protein FAES_4043 [Fibrella aestuarina BUZ 2]